MARPETSPAARIRELEKSLVKAKALPRKTTLTAKPMADLLGISHPTLVKWADEIPGFATSGTFDRGDRGIEWAFRPSAAIRFLIKHFTAERDKRTLRAQRVRKIAAGNDLDEAPAEMSLDELTKLIRLNTELQATKERSGQLIDAAKASATFIKAFTAMQQAVIRSAQEQDPASQWPPELREKFEDATRNILLRMEQAGQVCLSELRGIAA